MKPENAEESLAFLESHNLPYVCVDMPQGFDSSVPPVAAATATDIAMVRFHGRNTSAWNVKSDTASERFRYDYAESELKEWVPKIESLAEQTRETHVLMNNCYRDFGVRNARDLGDMLDLDRMESGRMSIRTTDVDINEVLSDAIARAGSSPSGLSRTR